MTTIEYDALPIGGQMRSPAGTDRIAVVSSSTQEPIGSTPSASVADVDAAVRAARSAFDDPHGWSSWEPSRRAETLRRFAEVLETRGEDIGARVAAQNGMPISLAVPLEGGAAARLLRQYADMAEVVENEEVRTGPGSSTIVRHEAIGVVGRSPRGTSRSRSPRSSSRPRSRPAARWC